MPHHLQSRCFNCGAAIDTMEGVDDGYALYTSEVEFFSPQGVRTRTSVVKRVICTECGEFAESHPVRFPSPVSEE